MRRIINFLTAAPALTISIAMVVLAYHSVSLFGQNSISMASLSGKVADPQGAQVAGATVTVFNTGQNSTRSFKTDSSGTFSFTLLPPAVYSLKVEAAGFKKFNED